MIYEMKRSPGRHTRISYYTDIDVILNNVLDFKFSFKLDTGSNYTVVGIDMLDKEIIEYLIKNCTFCNNDSALDATGNKLRMFKLNVCAFYLTPDVCLNNLELFFFTRFA